MPTELTFDSKELLQSVKVVKSFVSTEETRYYLNGILFRWTGTHMLLVATDGRRLIQRKLRGCSFVSGDVGEFSAIYPKQMLKPLNGLLENSLLTPVTLAVSPHTKRGTERLQFCFSNPDAKLTVTAIDGTYPDYLRVIPEKKNSRNGFNARYLYEALAVLAENGQDRALESMTIDIHYEGESDGKGAQLINATGEDDTLIVLMPKVAS